MKNYPKIETVFKRSESGSKNILPGVFRNSSVEFLKDNKWVFTEKIDGMNIGVEWDGHEVTFHGHSSKSILSNQLEEKLNVLFKTNEAEELFEQLFGDKCVTLFGEGYGNKIQKNGDKYRDDVNFILFDVYFQNENIWLERENIQKIADAFNIEIVPIILTGTIEDGVNYVKFHYNSKIGKEVHEMEGIVGKPMVEMLDRRGERIIVKIKWCDFKNLK